jgi:hypothetical protein
MKEEWLAWIRNTRNLRSEAGDSQAPEKKPNKMAKAIVPGALSMPKVTKTRIDAIVTQGTTVFHTPK